MSLITLNISNLDKTSTMMFIPYSYINVIAKVTMAAAVIITIVSGLDYFIKNKEAINTEK